MTVFDDTEPGLDPDGTLSGFILCSNGCGWGRQYWPGGEALARELVSDHEITCVRRWPTS